MKVMRKVSNYSFVWNEAQDAWIARYRSQEGPWKTKWLGRLNGRNDPIQAERAIIDFYQKYIKGEIPVKNSTSPIKKNLKLMAPKWLELRYNSDFTKPNTYAGMCNTVKNKLLNSPIANLDLETELTVSVVVEWINSLTGAYKSRISYISHFATLMRDCMGHGFLDENKTIDVFHKPTVKEAIARIRDAELSKKKKKKTKPIYMRGDEMIPLLTGNAKIPDYRRVRYLLALSTGMRDAELQGMTWDNVNFNEAIINVDRQLMKLGRQPAKDYDDLIMDHVSKEEMSNLPNAIICSPKADSHREIPLHPLTVKVLLYWKTVGWKRYVGRMPTDKDPIFPRGNSSLKPGEVRDAFCFCESPKLLRKDLEKLKIINPKLTFHSLRRTFATMLATAGVPQDVRNRLMGHSADDVGEEHYDGAEIEVSRKATMKLPLPDFVQMENLRIYLTEPSSIPPGDTHS